METPRQLEFEFSDAVLLDANIREHSAISPMQRPIHYLGSKLRLIDQICQAIDEVDESGGSVCDLFAGSGTVSLALGRSRSVVAVDIQEYSRVICSALLNPAPIALSDIESKVETARTSERHGALSEAFAPMIEMEAQAMTQALNGSPSLLCDFLESSSLLRHRAGDSKPEFLDLDKALERTSRNLKASGGLAGRASLVSNYFGGVYFSFKQAVELDAILSCVFREDTEERDTFLAPVLSTASEIVNTVGKQFAQPIRPRKRDGSPKDGLADRVEADRGLEVFSIYRKWLATYAAVPQPKFEHSVFRMDFGAALRQLPPDISALYADPPYTRDHYSRYYHVLETISLRDQPKVTTVASSGERRLSRGLYRERRHQSPFSIRSQAPNAFDSLFKDVAQLGIPLVLSYSPSQTSTPARPRPRLLTIGEVERIASRHFDDVQTTYPKAVTHSKLNTTDKNAEKLEFGEALILCR